jgi:ABC-type transport system involved in cytochrome bd biosynthesis fused ATPase/permease subunit
MRVCARGWAQGFLSAVPGGDGQEDVNQKEKGKTQVMTTQQIDLLFRYLLAFNISMMMIFVILVAILIVIVFGRRRP